LLVWIFQIIAEIVALFIAVAIIAVV
jgi:hypothetical protein